jgi:hypothetical protein
MPRFIKILCFKKEFGMRNREIFMLSALTFSMGIVMGFLISPAKNGFGNNSGNTTNHYYQKKPAADDES